MKVTILGNNSALPAYGRFPTAQIVEVQDQYFLVDCGEGAQMRMQQYGVRSSRIQHIFISHVHGDHYLGLVGFVSSQSLLGRVRPMHIYCPAKVKEFVSMQLPWGLGFDIEYHITDDAEHRVLLETDKLRVSCFPVYHSVPTHGFIFCEKKRKRKLIPRKLQEYEIPKYFYRQLTEGQDYIAQDGTCIKNEWLTEPGLPPKKYVFAADSRYAPEILPDIEGADLLYHEATYLHDQLPKAIDRFHTTARQAGELAAQANVGRLLIGHFSSKYKKLEPFLEEARMYFPETELAIEGMSFEVRSGE